MSPVGLVPAAGTWVGSSVAPQATSKMKAEIATRTMRSASHGPTCLRSVPSLRMTIPFGSLGERTELSSRERLGIVVLGWLGPPGVYLLEESVDGEGPGMPVRAHYAHHVRGKQLHRPVVLKPRRRHDLVTH